jgi:C4-dicarboxylate-binding protein DctP
MSKIESDSYKAAKENGMKVVTLTDAQVAAFRKASASVIDDYIKKTGGKGGVGDKLVQIANKL